MLIQGSHRSRSCSTSAISEVNETISRLRSELKDEMANMKVSFGKEILRIDKQQMQIVTQMEKYEAQVKKFTYDVMKLKVDAEKFAMRWGTPAEQSKHRPPKEPAFDEQHVEKP